MRIHELRHVYFLRERNDEYVMRVRYVNDRSGRVFRYKVRSGRAYFVLNRNRVVDMETNLELPLYEGEDYIDAEAKRHNDFVESRKGFFDKILNK